MWPFCVRGIAVCQNGAVEHTLAGLGDLILCKTRLQTLSNMIGVSVALDMHNPSAGLLAILGKVCFCEDVQPWQPLAIESGGCGNK